MLQRYLMMIAVAALSPAMAAPAGAEEWRPPVTRSMIEAQFTLFEPDYAQLRSERLAKLQPLEEKLFDMQSQGQPMFCSAHILNEVRWLLNSTTQWSRIDKQLWLLKVSLLDPEQGFAIDQESHDGSWGVCYDEWFKKLDPMIQAINGMTGKDIPPSYSELDFLKPIATPEELLAYLRKARVSDIAATGLNRRDELGAVTSVVAEIAFKEHVQDFIARHIKGIDLDDGYVDAFKRFVDEWQDPVTGYWGAWYRIGDEVRKSTDLSFTYHIVAYRKGEVAHWDRIVDTTLALHDREYPYGWQHHGTMTDHNAYDVVRILEYGWPHMDDARRHRASAAIGEMLDWSLGTSLQPDGAFKAAPGFASSVSDAQYYGVSLLTKAGYCSQKGPFWTDRTWPDAGEVCCRIAARLAAFSQSIPAAEAARSRLAEAYPRCPGPPAADRPDTPAPADDE